METSTYIILIGYIAMIAVTYHICTPEEKEMDIFDEITIPILSFLWPLAWGFVIVNEIIGFLIQKIRGLRQAKKKKRHQQARENALKNNAL